MLEFFRSRIKNNIFFKIFLGLLALSFGIWGVGDFMGTSPLAPGISVRAGNSEVRTDTLQRRYNFELDRLRQAMGGRSIDNQVLKQSVMSTLMQDVNREVVVDAAARDLGLVASRDLIREQIMTTPAFQQNGQFSQVQFEQTLMNNQLTESGYIQLAEKDMRRSLLMQPLVMNAGAPQFLVESLFAYRNETRVADTVLVPSSAMTVQKAPTDDELKAVYDKNIAAFTAPEYRKLTVLLLAATDLVKPESLDEAEVKKFYDDNSARYRTPEKRRVSHLNLTSKEEADAVRAKATPGESLEALAAKTNAGTVIDLGELTPTSPMGTMLPGAFQAKPGEISQPIQSQLGWHLVEVKSLVPETVRTFEEAKDEIRNTIALDKGSDAVYDASTRMEDALASGTPPDEVAKSIGARAVKIEAIDRDGNDPSGNSVPGIIDPQNFITTAFATPVAKDSRLMDLPTRDGYYVIHVDAITPSAPKPLDTVRTQVVALWEAEQKMAQAQQVADKLAADAGPSVQLSALEAKDKRASYAPLGPVTRFGDGLEVQHIIDSTRVSPQLLEKLFNAKVGDVFTAPVATGVLVARVKEINVPVAAGSLQAAREQMALSLRNDIGSDINDQFLRALTKRYPVEVDQKSVDTIVGVQ